MHFVVLPLSAFPFKLTYTALRLFEGFAVHALLGLGLASALIRRRHELPPDVLRTGLDSLA
ncbi:MAG: hypothetical protein ACRETF_00935 [Nevskiaceae bacterium]